MCTCLTMVKLRFEWFWNVRKRCHWRSGVAPRKADVAKIMEARRA
jgi:hypothetical protein